MAQQDHESPFLPGHEIAGEYLSPNDPITVSYDCIFPVQPGSLSGFTSARWFF